MTFAHSIYLKMSVESWHVGGFCRSLWALPGRCFVTMTEAIRNAEMSSTKRDRQFSGWPLIRESTQEADGSIESLR